MSDSVRFERKTGSGAWDHLPLPERKVENFNPEIGSGPILTGSGPCCGDLVLHDKLPPMKGKKR
jgi:hypothetical protein